MSIVVAIKEDDVIYIGADSQATAGYSKYTLSNKNNYKIWEVKNTRNTLMGGVGSLREINVASVSEGIIPELASIKKEVDFSCMVKTVVPNLFSTLKNNSVITSKDGELLRLNGAYLIATSDKLFSIDFDGCVVEVDDCVAIGSGEHLAIGSLHSTTGKQPKERIIEAIRAVAQNNITVGYPIVISDTKSMKFEVIIDKEN